MKTFPRQTVTALAAGIAMLLGLSLVACDPGAEAEIAAPGAQVDEASQDVTIDEKAGAEPSESFVIPESDGYLTGYTFGSQLARLKYRHPDYDLKGALSGLIDALGDALITLDVTDLSTALQTLSPPTVVALSEPEPIIPRSAPIVARTKGFKDDFAALNAMRDGVVSLPSGVQYEVLKAGSGAQPTAADAVLVNYQASLTNGTVFDTTYEDGEPMRLPLNEIAVPGLREALLLMNEGAQWRVVIPPSMGFGRTSNNMMRRRDLIYEIELISIEKAKPAEISG